MVSVRGARRFNTVMRTMLSMASNDDAVDSTIAASVARNDRPDWFN